MSSTNHPQNPDVVGLSWRKSSYSEGGNGQCVEVGALATIGLDGVAIRDSKVEDGPVMVVGEAAFAAFVNGARA